VLLEGSLVLISGELALVVDVEVSVLGIPVWIAERVLFLQVLLWPPELLAAMRVLLGGEGPGVFRNVHLILRHQLMNTIVHLVLEESVWHTQVVVWLNSDWQLTWNWIPRVLVHLPDRRITERHHGHLVVGGCWPEDLDLLSLGVCHDLSGKVSLISLVEHIDAVVDDQVSVVDLLLGRESKLLDPQSFFPRETRGSPHQLFDVRGLRSVVPWALHLTVELLDVLHGEWAVVWRNWAALSDWMDVPHVVDGAWGRRVVTLDDSIVVLGAIA